MKSKIIVIFAAIVFLTAIVSSDLYAYYILLNCETCWSTVGSTGTVDEGDMSKVQLADEKVAVNSTATLPTTVTIRYNIQPFAPSQNEQMEGYGLKIGYIDYFRYSYSFINDESSIKLYIKRIDLATGAKDTIAIFDSNEYPQQVFFYWITSPEIQVVDVEMSGLEFDFSHNAYYIEAVLYKDSVYGGTSLHFIKLCPQFWIEV